MKAHEVKSSWEDKTDEGKRGFSSVKPTAFTLNMKQLIGPDNKAAEILIGRRPAPVAAPGGLYSLEVIRQDVGNVHGFHSVRLLGMDTWKSCRHEPLLHSGSRIVVVVAVG